MSRPIIYLSVMGGMVRRESPRIDADVTIIIKDYDIDGIDPKDLTTDANGLNYLRYTL